MKSRRGKIGWACSAHGKEEYKYLVGKYEGKRGRYIRIISK
jgi:hypothetical protein